MATLVSGVKRRIVVDQTVPDRGLMPARKSFQDFLYCIQKGYKRRLHDTYLTGYESTASNMVRKAAMGEESGAVGGYLVPLDYTQKLMQVIVEDSFIFPRANVIPMASRMTTCPKIDVETVPAAAGTSPFFGGIKFTWGGSQAPAETEQKFRALDLQAWDLLGFAVASNQFLMDIGPAGEEWLFYQFGRAAVWAAEFAFLQGTGTAQQMPLGILNAPAAISVTRAGGGTISNLDIGKMAAKMLPFGWKNAIWVTNPTTLEKISQIANVFLNIPPAGKDTSSHTGYIWGRPLFVTDALPALGTKGDLTFFDPSLYVIGLRQEVLIDVSDQSAGFASYQTNIRIWLRLDGKPQVSNTITLQDTVTTVSPYVILN